ncbi:hypothetical protein [Clostridium butyricum]|uniref:hypothetical protein n=1 Tax=Clostridium butyricum TaxID=1492 RepID=UPI002ABDCC32|nr:hypothetical protein [Clostridium butyricum]
MNIVKRTIDKILDMPVDEEKIFKVTRLIGSIMVSIFMIVTAKMMIKDTINDTKEKTEYIQVEGKVIECTMVPNNTIWSFIGFEENTEYKTIIKVDSKILESNNKEIYYLCKDKIDSDINLNVKTYDGEMNSIEKIIN